MKRFALGLAAILMATAAYAADPAKTMDTTLGKVWTDQKGMTLYTFDNDKKGETMSACTDKCITAWPPFLAAEGDKAEGDWTIIDVKDKDGAMKKMWAYQARRRDRRWRRRRLARGQGHRVAQAGSGDILAGCHTGGAVGRRLFVRRTSTVPSPGPRIRGQ